MGSVAALAARQYTGGAGSGEPAQCAYAVRVPPMPRNLLLAVRQAFDPAFRAVAIKTAAVSAALFAALILALGLGASRHRAGGHRLARLDDQGARRGGRGGAQPHAVPGCLPPWRSASSSRRSPMRSMPGTIRTSRRRRGSRSCCPRSPRPKLVPGRPGAQRSGPAAVSLAGAECLCFLRVERLLVGPRIFRVGRAAPTGTGHGAARVQEITVAIFVGGILITLLLSIPVVNWLMPMIATAFMVHEFDALERRHAGT